MCNIAGYSGSKQAAPILLEMLRRQQPYDGDMSTGVATIYEGKLYSKKIVGDVDEFLRTIDLSELPGTIGIVHTRPMQVILENGEAYMATARYAFPAELQNEPIMLPLFNACIVTKDGIKITSDKMEMEPVSEMTPYTYAEAYKRFETILKSDKAPVYFDDLECAVRDDMRDLWPGDHTCIQHGRLVYDMLWQFDRDGRLKREMRIQKRGSGTRHRWYFWLED